jgi:acetylornithine deacetylase/succinyl-diaminopimelate desuccinylase-like protein
VRRDGARNAGWTDAEFALNSMPAAAPSPGTDARSLRHPDGEKTYQSFTFSATNKGGHSSRPRPDNAIYDLAGALKRLEAHRFTPMLNETTRAYFTERAKMEKGPLGEAMRRWVADPKTRRPPTRSRRASSKCSTRTRCVATRLEGGHADNALPQLARATVNCRIMPGIDPKAVEAELKRVAGSGVEVAVSDPGVPTPASPLRADVVRAYTQAVHKRHPGAAIIPKMSTGATDGLYFRAAGIPVYGVDGSWGISPTTSAPTAATSASRPRRCTTHVDHWADMLKRWRGSDGRTVIREGWDPGG